MKKQLFSGAGGQPAKTSPASNLEPSTGQGGFGHRAMDVFPKVWCRKHPLPPLLVQRLAHTGRCLTLTFPSSCGSGCH